MPAPPPLDTLEDERSLERYLIVGLALMILLIVAFPFYRVTEPARRARAVEETARENVALGREAYALHCAGCHGDEGRGGRGMPTLAAREFLSEVSDAQVHWLIAGGIPGTTMAAYDLDLGGPFTAQEIGRVAAYLRSLEAEAPSVPGWRSGAAAPAPVVETTAVADRSVAVRSPAPADPSPNSSPAEMPGPAARVAESRSAGEEAMQRSGTGPESPMRVEEHPAPVERASVRDEAAANPLDTGALGGAQESYRTYCGACHGQLGEGTPIAPAVRPPAPPLDGDFEALVTAIAQGSPGTAMMGFDRATGGPLEREAIERIARWLQEPSS